MSSKFNELYRSGPGFSSGQISALGGNGSKLDDPDFSLPNNGRGYDQVPKGYREYVAKKAAAAEEAKGAGKKAKADAKAAAKAAKAGGKDTLTASGAPAGARKGVPGAKPSHESHVARALHMLDPRKHR